MTADAAETSQAGRKKDRRPNGGQAKSLSRDNGNSEPDRSKERLVRENLPRQLCALITNGTYKPGDHMTERELCERLAASRPSIRETLRQLEAQGLVDIYPNRGAVVRKLSKNDFLQLWEVRQVLEMLAAERFARSGRPELIKRLDVAIDRMDTALRSREPKKIKTAMAMMFEAFMAGAESELLSDYVRQINVRLSFLWSSSLLFEGRPRESVGELRTLLEAIRTNNVDAARAAIVPYNEHAKAVALAVLEGPDRK
jgi:DNA-binding GntR family transcriptional regulator